jgi:hypothetical protein
MVTTLSKRAPASLFSDRQYATAFSHKSSFGAKGRPRIYSIVVSSTAIMPARAPASIAILHNVMRPSMESRRIALPANSIA